MSKYKIQQKTSSGVVDLPLQADYAENDSAGFNIRDGSVANMLHLGAYDTYTYADESYTITRQTGYKEVNGSEEWVYESIYLRFNGHFSNPNIAGDGEDYGISSSPIFPYNIYPLGGADDTSSICIYTGGGIYLKYKGHTTVSDLISQLASSPVYIQYKLATSTTETYDIRPFARTGQPYIEEWKKSEADRSANLLSVFVPASAPRGIFVPITDFILQAGTYTITERSSSNTGQYQVFFNGSATATGTADVGKSITFTITSATTSIRLYQNSTNSGINVMLNAGSVALPYQPYEGPVIHKTGTANKATSDKNGLEIDTGYLKKSDIVSQIPLRRYGKILDKNTSAGTTWGCVAQIAISPSIFVDRNITLLVESGYGGIEKKKVIGILYLGVRNDNSATTCCVNKFTWLIKNDNTNYPLSNFVVISNGLNVYLFVKTVMQHNGISFSVLSEKDTSGVDTFSNFTMNSIVDPTITDLSTVTGTQIPSTMETIENNINGNTNGTAARASKATNDSAGFNIRDSSVANMLHLGAYDTYTYDGTTGKYTVTRKTTYNNDGTQSESSSKNIETLSDRYFARTGQPYIEEWKKSEADRSSNILYFENIDVTSVKNGLTCTFNGSVLRITGTLTSNDYTALPFYFNNRSLSAGTYIFKRTGVSSNTKTGGYIIIDGKLDDGTFAQCNLTDNGVIFVLSHKMYLYRCYWAISSNNAGTMINETWYCSINVGSVALPYQPYEGAVVHESRISNVDNTSDLNKPVSTATQTALTNEATARSSADTTLQTNIDTVSASLDDYLPLAGGTLSGPLYFSSQSSYVSGNLGILNYSGNLFLSAPSSALYFAHMGTNSLILDWSNITSGTRTQYFQSKSGTIALTSDLSSYLPLSGGTMTGPITLQTSISGSGSGNIPLAGAGITGVNALTDFSNYPSYLGTTSISNTWYSIISVRHRNGSGDGTGYGLYLQSIMTSSGNLIWNKQKSANSWQGERTLLDSSNYTSYVNITNFPGLDKTGTVTSVTAGDGLTGGPITGTGTISVPTGGITNAMLAGSIANDKITNNYIIVNGNTVYFGTSVDTPNTTYSDGKNINFSGTTINLDDSIEITNITAYADQGGNTGAIGTSDVPFSAIYATTFYGALSGNSITGTVAIANGGTGASTASAARTNLGLGSLATQSALTAAQVNAVGTITNSTTGNATTATTASYAGNASGATFQIGTGYPTVIYSNDSSKLYINHSNGISASSVSYNYNFPTSSTGNATAGTVSSPGSNTLAVLTSNVASSTKLSSARSFALTGGVTGSASSDLTSGVSISTSLSSSELTSTLQTAYSSSKPVTSNTSYYAYGTSGSWELHQGTTTGNRLFIQYGKGTWSSGSSDPSAVVTWSHSFPNTNYSVAIGINGSALSYYSPVITSKETSKITITAPNADSYTDGGTFEVIGIYSV